MLMVCDLVNAFVLISSSDTNGQKLCKTLT